MKKLVTLTALKALILITSVSALAQTDNVVENGILTLPVVQAGDDAYYLELALVPGTDPIQLQPVSALLLFNPAHDKNTSYFDANTGTLEVPLLIFEDTPFELDMSVANANPIILQLDAAEVLSAQEAAAPFVEVPQIPISAEVDLSLPPANATTVSNLQLPQPFTFYFVQTVDSAGQVKCLAGNDVTRPNADANGHSYMTACRNTPDQIWQFFETHEFGYPGYFHFTNAKPITVEKCMESAFFDPATQTGSGAYMNDCFTDEFGIFQGQLFKPSSQGGGLQFENLVREGFNECLDSNSSNGAVLNGAVYMNTCDGSAAQIWSFVEFEELNKVLDDDGDSIVNISDNCPAVANFEQTDSNSDGQGDACTVDLSTAIEPFRFSVANNQGNTIGAVEGVIFGLLNNRDNQSAISITLTSFPSELGQLPSDVSLDVTTWSNVTVNSFDVQDGQIVSGSFSAQNSTGTASESSTFVLGGALNTPCCDLIRNGLTVNNGQNVTGNSSASDGVAFVELQDNEVLIADEGLVADKPNAVVVSDEIISISTPMLGESYFLQSEIGVINGTCLEGNRNRIDAVVRGYSYLDNCQNVTGQLWKFVDQSASGLVGYYKITNQFLESEGKCLEAGSYDAISGGGRGAFMASCNDSALLSSQLWKLISTGEGFKLQSLSHSPEVTNNCLQSNSPPSLTLDGGAFMEPCSSNAGQQWRLVQASDFEKFFDPTDTMIAFVGDSRLYTRQQVETQLANDGLELVMGPELGPNQCTTLYVDADADDIRAKGGLFVCNKVDIGGNTDVSIQAIYGGCDFNNPSTQGGGSMCDVGTVSANFRYQASDDPVVFETVTANGPSAEECIAVSSEFTCLKAGASLASASYEVMSENGSGAEVGLDVGVGFEGEFGVNDEGTVTFGAGASLGIGVSFKISYNINDGPRELYELGRSAWVRTPLGGIVVASDKALANALGVPSVDSQIIGFIDDPSGTVMAVVTPIENAVNSVDVDATLRVMEEGLDQTLDAVLDTSADTNTFVNTVVDSTASTSLTVVTFLAGLF
ncbi:MAG: hypothetical protein NPIRA05_03920 [Nitrospirales bacterium]|nr:MAG: hypothetical protein NPIRA05_03920 [Nitrospirales bacterium]